MLRLLVLREKLLPELSPTIQGDSHTLPNAHCKDQSPFAAGDSSEPTAAPFQLPTRSLSDDSSSLKLDPGSPEAESLTQRTPDEFIEWSSGVKQLELGASRGGPQTKKSLGKSTWTI